MFQLSIFSWKKKQFGIQSKSRLQQRQTIKCLSFSRYTFLRSFRPNFVRALKVFLEINIVMSTVDEGTHARTNHAQQPAPFFHFFFFNLFREVNDNTVPDRCKNAVPVRHRTRDTGYQGRRLVSWKWNLWASLMM